MLTSLRHVALCLLSAGYAQIRSERVAALSHSGLHHRLGMDDQAVPLSQSYYSKLIVAHAVFGGLAAMITAPAAILTARYLRRSRWFPIHAALQIVTAIAVIITFALGTRAVLSGGHGVQLAGKGATHHHQLGLAVLILVLVQSAGGAFVHRLSRGHIVRWAHVVCGIVVAGALYVQFKLGFQQWNENTDTGTTVPRGVSIVFWVVLALEIAAYVVGLLVGDLPARRSAAFSSFSTSDSKLPMRETA